MSTDAGPLVPFFPGIGELTLVKPSWLRHDFTLETATGQAVVRLHYGLSGSAEGRTASEAWKLSRPRGLLQRRLEVTELASGLAVATIDLSVWSRGGDVQVGDEQYEVSAKGVITPRWSLSRDGVEVVVVSKTGSLGENKAHVTVSSDDPNAPLLVLLAVHAIVTYERQAHSAASSSSAT